MFLLRDLVSPRTWLAMAQHLAGLLMGFVAIFIVTFGLGFGAGGLFFALVGLPLLGVTLWLANWFAAGRAGQVRLLHRRADPGLARPGLARPGRLPVGHHPALADVAGTGDLVRDRLRAAAAAGQRGRGRDQHPGLVGGPGHAGPAGLRLGHAFRRPHVR